jgi:hypothetical protein
MCVKWKEEELVLLGTMEDHHLAYIIGRTPHAVALRRSIMRIPRCYDTPAVIREYAEAMKTAKKNREIALQKFCRESRRIYRRIMKYKYLFGTMPDAELSMILGVPRLQLMRIRQDNGIPIYRRRQYEPVIRCKFCGCIIPSTGTDKTTLYVCISVTCKRRRRLKYGARYRVSKQLRVATRTLEKMYEQSCNG